MRASALALAAVTACTVLAGCSAPVDGRPVVHVVDVAQPSVALPPERALPTADELATTLHVTGNGLMSRLVAGGTDMLLRSVSETGATPVECIGPAYRLQDVVYRAHPVQAVASQSWFGGDVGGPRKAGFFGVVAFTSADDAQAFFATSAQTWRRCDGQTLVIDRPGRGADSASRITDVTVNARTASALVLQDAGASHPATIQRAIGVAANLVVDVEITDEANTADTGAAAGAVDVAELMLDKITRNR